MSRRRADIPPWGPGGVPIALVLGVGGGFAATIAVELAGAAGGGSLAHPSPIITLMASLAFDLAFVGAALRAARARGPVRPADFGYRLPGLAHGLGWTFLGAVVYFAGSALYGILVHLPAEKLPKELGFGSGAGALVAAGVFVCVIAPILEELFFRGYLFGALRQLPLRIGRAGLGTPVAALLVGLLFGLAHAGSAAPKYLVPLALFGIVLCVVRWRTGSLYPGMALHSINNSLALGINQLGWSAGRVVALVVGGLLAVALLTLPLSRARFSGGAGGSM